jgi:hypothetical protein
MVSFLFFEFVRCFSQRGVPNAIPVPKAEG